MEPALIFFKAVFVTVVFIFALTTCVALIQLCLDMYQELIEESKEDTTDTGTIQITIVKTDKSRIDTV